MNWIEASALEKNSEKRHSKNAPTGAHVSIPVAIPASPIMYFCPLTVLPESLPLKVEKTTLQGQYTLSLRMGLRE
jgi:hypothetical protein